MCITNAAPNAGEPKQTDSKAAKTGKSELAAESASETSSASESATNSNNLYIVHWRLNGTTGHGEPMPYQEAKTWANSLNKDYGPDTHWLEPA